MDRSAPIAVFDSGVGGVSVLKELIALMPNEQYYYFGDSVNAPYGLKSTEQVRDLTLAAAEKLFGMGAKALVVACNTATAAAIEDLRRTYPDRIVIGIEPALKLARDRHPGGTIGIMATDVTLRERKLAALMDRFSAECRIIRLPSPGVVELVEAGKADSEEAVALMEAELGHLKKELDALVLGCTHYPFISGAIRKVVGPQVDLLDGGEGTARETRRRLKEGALLSDGPGGLTVEVSAGGEEKERLIRQLLIK